MNPLDLSMRVLHILGATMLVGAIIYQRCAVVPALQQLGNDDAVLAARETLRRRASIITMMSAFLLLLSGFVNTARLEMNYKLSSEYHMLLGIKLLLAVVIFALASLLAGRTSTAQKLRQKAATWLNILIVISLVVYALAGAMKFSDHEPKTKQLAAPNSEEAP